MIIVGSFEESGEFNSERSIVIRRLEIDLFWSVSVG